MTTRKWNIWLLAGAACLLAAPYGAAAGDYLKGKTSYKTPEERAAAKNQIKAPPPPQVSPFAVPGTTIEDFKPDPMATQGQPAHLDTLSPEELAKRRYIDDLVQQRMEAMMSGGDDDGHAAYHNDINEFTAEDFQSLVAKAQTGDADAIGLVGNAYHNGLGVERNAKQAAEWYKSAIEYGKTEYYGPMGELYRDFSAAEEKPGFLEGLKQAFTDDDKKLEPSDTIARQWFEKGVAAGDWQSYLKLGEMYRDGKGGLEQDPKRAKWFYNEGLRLKQRHDAELMRQVEQKIRAQVIQEVEQAYGAGGND